MSGREEKYYLLNNPSIPDNGANVNLFPPIPSNYLPKGNNTNPWQPHSPPPPYYGVVEVVPTNNGGPTHFEHSQPQRPQSRGPRLITVIIVVIAIAVGLALIMSLAKSAKIHYYIHNAERYANASHRGKLQAAAPSQLSQSPPQTYEDIEIPQGLLRGYKKQSRQGREYTAFFKVPYAAPPLGSLRFKDPSPALAWTGLRDVPVVAPQCLQKEKYPKPNEPSSFATGEEDCLYANIYTPVLPPPSQAAAASSERLPVMVYIHGGGVQGNGSRYGADYFMDEDVVLITFQYRLGPFGSLSTGDDIIQGNMGLKDQVQMLKWVKDNVHHFNGNPDLVTIFGNSKGGMNVGYVLMSPMSNGLFHRAISQSGSGLCDYYPHDVNDKAGKDSREELGRQMGCDTSDSQKYLECLQSKPAAELAVVLSSNATYPLTIENFGGVEESSKFMPEMPFKLAQSGRSNPVPYLLGNVNAEFYNNAVTLLLDENQVQSLNADFEDSGSLFDVQLGLKDMRKVREFYFGGKPIGNDTLRPLGDLFSDRELVHCSYLAARYHANLADTYLYWLTKPPYKSYIDKQVPGFPAKEMGIVHHADELQFIFLYDGYPEITKDDQEYFEFSKNMVKTWVNFAKTGTASMDGVDWQKVNGQGDGDAKATFWLELSDTPASTTAPQERMGFWDQFDLGDLHYDY